MRKKSKPKHTPLPKEHPMDQPVQLKPGQIRVTVVGQGLVFVENHGGLVQYTGEKILLRAGKGLLSLEGKNLMLSHMQRGVLRVSGTMVSLAWQGGANGDR